MERFLKYKKIKNNHTWTIPIESSTETMTSLQARYPESFPTKSEYGDSVRVEFDADSEQENSINNDEDLSDSSKSYVPSSSDDVTSKNAINAAVAAAIEDILPTAVQTHVDNLLEKSEIYNNIEQKLKDQEKRLTRRLDHITCSVLETKIGALEQTLSPMNDTVTAIEESTDKLNKKLDRLTRRSAKVVDKLTAAVEEKISTYVEAMKSQIRNSNTHETVHDDTNEIDSLPIQENEDDSERFKYIPVEGDQSQFRKYDTFKNEIEKGSYRLFQGKYNPIQQESSIPPMQSHGSSGHPVQMTLVDTSQYGRGFSINNGENPYQRYVQLQQVTKFSAKTKITSTDDILVVFKAMSSVGLKYNIFLKDLKLICDDNDNTRALSFLTPENCDNYEAAISDSSEALYLLAEKYVDNTYTEGCNIINDLSENRDGFKVWYRLLKKASPHLMDPTYDMEGDVDLPSYDDSLQQYNRSFASYLIKKEIMGHKLSSSAKVLEYLKHLPPPYASVVQQLRTGVRTYVLQQRQQPNIPFPPHLTMEEVYHNTEVIFPKHRENGSALAAISSLESMTEAEYERLSRVLSTEGDFDEAYSKSGTGQTQVNTGCFGRQNFHQRSNRPYPKFNRSRNRSSGPSGRGNRYGQRSRSYSPKRVTRKVTCSICGKYGHDFDRHGGYCEFLAQSAKVKTFIEKNKKNSDSDYVKAVKTNLLRFEQYQSDKGAIARVAEIVTEEYGVNATIEDISAKVNSLAYSDEMSQASATSRSTAFHQEEDDFNNGDPFHWVPS